MSTNRRTFLAQSISAAGFAAMSLRDGQLRAEDIYPAGKSTDLILRGKKPFNAEPRLPTLVADYLTPVEHFFVRNHAPPPALDVAKFRLTVEGLVNKSLSLSLSEIRERFRAHEITATLTCAGNRRTEHAAIKPLGGLQWDAGAISTSTWKGAALADLLAAAGIKEGAKHVWFEGLDQIQEKDGSVVSFDGSIPLERLEQVDRDTLPLVAYGMAGKELTPDHGYPLRTVVPGFIGARSVKWLGRIVVSDRPSANKYVTSDYKIVAREEKEFYANSAPIYAWATNAAICMPVTKSKLNAGRTTVRGYALAAGERDCRIVQVELSRDGGKSWMKANLGTAKPGFNWVHWHLDVDLPPGDAELICRATDSRGFTMPERVEWNAKGYLYNGWHRVVVNVNS